MPERAPEHTLTIGQSVTVSKLNSAGVEVFAYAGIVAHIWPSGARLDATWTRGPMALDYTTFEPGDRFIEWYFTDRWYNIMEVRGAGDVLKGWYCNITYPAEFEQDRISYRDLALDLWVDPEGATITLDEDEFAADPEIDAFARAHALDALGYLSGLVARRVAPFDALPAS